MAAGIVIDAIVARSLLVPALVALIWPGRDVAGAKSRARPARAAAPAAAGCSAGWHIVQLLAGADPARGGPERLAEVADVTPAAAPGRPPCAV